MLDTIVALEMTATGRIQVDSLKFKSSALGELTVKLADCRDMVFSLSGRVELAIDAAKHGSDLNQWLDTGAEVARGDSLSIRATGSVELWPQGPGMYTATPKGYNTAGKGGQFMAGSLVAKIGNGNAFFVGEKLDWAAGETGRLFLAVTPSPWNNASSGGYRVEVVVGTN